MDEFTGVEVLLRQKNGMRHSAHDRLLTQRPVQPHDKYFGPWDSAYESDIRWGY
jgi:hypothetical protein